MSASTIERFSGVFTALVTPFERGVIDETSLRRLVRQQLAGGIQGFVVAGTTGESPTIDSDERRQIFNIVKSESSNQTPIVMGTGSNSTKQAIKWTAEAAELGADAALVVVPYYNKPPQRGLIAHFKSIANASSIPILLYNVPGRTVARMEVETIAELSYEPNIIGVKEATGDIEFGKRVIEACGPDFLVTSGDDATAFELAHHGGQGVISVASHILPKLFVTLMQRARKGDRGVTAEYMQSIDLINYLYCESNPIPVKAALEIMGVISSPELRLPLCALDQEHALELRNRMAAAGLLS